MHHNSRFRSLTSSTLQLHNSFYTHQMWWDKSTYVSITCWQADAKKRKLRQTLGMSTLVASQTGLPWSRDSASANSSRHASTLSAIVLRYLARSAGDVLLQLQKCEQHIIMPRWAEPQRYMLVGSCVCVCMCECMPVTRVSRRLLQARHWRVQSRHNATISQTSFFSYNMIWSPWCPLQEI